MNRLDRTLKLIDQANRADPHQELAGGQPQPKEWLYGQRMSQMLESFKPGASDHLKIAARAQHIERWKSPRANYPEGRSGYKKWRAELGLFHAQRTGELMREAGYPDPDTDRVKYLLQKRSLKTDAESQCLEDVVCLVFLQFYFDAFAAKHTENKLLEIIQKTWKKMSSQGQTAALQLPLSATARALVKKALAD